MFGEQNKACRNVNLDVLKWLSERSNGKGILPEFIEQIRLKNGYLDILIG